MLSAENDAMLFAKLQQAVEAGGAAETMSVLDELGLKGDETPTPTSNLAELAPVLFSLATAISYRGDMKKGTVGVIIDHVVPLVEPKAFALLVSLSCDVSAIASCGKLSLKTKLLLFSLRSASEESKEALQEPSRKKNTPYLFSNRPTAETVKELCEADLLPPYMIFSFLATCMYRPEASVVSTVSCSPLVKAQAL